MSRLSKIKGYRTNTTKAMPYITMLYSNLQTNISCTKLTKAVPPFQTQEFSKQSVSSWGGFSWVQHDRPTEPPQIRWPCKLRVAAPSRKQITVVRPSQMGQRSTRAHQVRNKTVFEMRLHSKKILRLHLCSSKMLWKCFLAKAWALLQFTMIRPSYGLYRT